MTSTYNHRAVRIVRRAWSIRQLAWKWVPPVAWLLSLDALALSLMALLCLLGMDPKSRGYFAQVHALDVLVGLAVLCVGGALFSSARAALCRFKAKSGVEKIARPVSARPGESALGFGHAARAAFGSPDAPGRPA